MNQRHHQFVLPFLCSVALSPLAQAQPAAEQPAAVEAPPAQAPPVQAPPAAPATDAVPAAPEPEPAAPVVEPMQAPAVQEPTVVEPQPGADQTRFEPAPIPEASEPVAPEEPAETFPRFDPSMRLLTGFEREGTRRFTTQGMRETERYGFFLGQARVQLQGELTKRIDLEISAELSDGHQPSTDGPQYIRDAFLNLRPEREFQVRAGIFKRPLSALEHRNAGKLQVRGRGLTNDVIVEDNAWGSRGLGMQLWGEFKKLGVEWAVGAFNPFWAADTDSGPKGADILARLAVEPLDGLTLGINGGLKTMKYPLWDKYEPFYAAGADVELELGGLFVLLDGLYAQLPVGQVPDQSAMGVVLLTSYDIPLAPALVLQPVVFGEYFDGSVDHGDSETLRMVAGVNWLVHETLRIMPQVEWVHWLGDPSEFSPSEGVTPYLMLSLAM